MQYPHCLRALSCVVYSPAQVASMLSRLVTCATQWHEVEMTEPLSTVDASLGLMATWASHSLSRPSACDVVKKHCGRLVGALHLRCLVFERSATNNVIDELHTQRRHRGVMGGFINRSLVGRASPQPVV
jgi:hypothetical protein